MATLADDKHFTLSPVRPRFRVHCKLSPDEVVGRINAKLREKDSPCIGKVISGYATILIPEEDQHYWSPQLSLTIEETPNGSDLRGLYGPRPAVWTMFMFFYSCIGFAAFMITMIGLSFLTLGKSIAILWWVPVLTLLFLSLYLVAGIGKRLGQDQIKIIHAFIENCTGLKIT